MNLEELPFLTRAIREACTAAGLQLVEACLQREFPVDDTVLIRAERCAEQIADKTLQDFLSPDMIDLDLADPTDSAFEMMCCGEQHIHDLLIAAIGSNAKALDDVLDGVVEGVYPDFIDIMGAAQ